ncbi:hypothetical protein EZS27_011749 [termite gut metagenome]|uniref:DNA methylase N-4/N-6 domain-containing protein n=1 Tax=termite gut metagenome TaxID=433724 RepID=A0A5J4S2S1_9ZZZZ
MENRFNRLTSKEWLPFQKSWFKVDTDEKFYKENIRFFVKGENEQSTIFYYGKQIDLVKRICNDENIKIHTEDGKNATHYEFVLIDLLDEINYEIRQSDYEKIKKDIIQLIQKLYPKIENRRFVAVLIKNIHTDNGYFPYAWELSKHLSTMLSLKDEKIGCKESTFNNNVSTKFYSTSKDFFYCLYFRKDENSDGIHNEIKACYFINNKQYTIKDKEFKKTPSWFVLKPQPRTKNEILHPAKYPEELVEIFLKEFTNENDNIIDPMSGTGSTQLASLKNNRNAYGTELSEFFTNIAINRCKEYLSPAQKSFWQDEKKQTFLILNKDARQITRDDFPEINYLITSPPYWDMLNMKGAENQAKRIEKGLQTNYSSKNDDLGNIDDYNEFLNELVGIYMNVVAIMEPGSFLTIIVKNIKKKGINYPFAWDLSEKLQEHLILLPENFWCQDDISIAPYGYGNTWVSNTFHQYCLNFQVPMKK